MTRLGYPADQNGNAGPTDSYTYDNMGRLSSNGATWGPAGELLTFANGTRTYNNLGQLTRIAAPGTMDMQYIYTPGQNNGRVGQTIDGVSGETVSYTYDALNRLATAQTASSAWGQAYTYDGWGNLTGKTVTKGTAPAYSANPDPSRNGGGDPTVVDASQDVENRGIASYGDGPQVSLRKVVRI
jgi:YD repeat-containing protein